MSDNKKIALFEPLQLRDVIFPNRIVMSPMCQYSAKEGVPNAWHLVHYGSRAVGGASLLMTEATAVLHEGRITPFDAGLWNDEQQNNWSQVVRFVEQQGAVMGIQLGHAGRKASTLPPWKGAAPILPDEERGWLPLAPSSIPYTEGYANPKMMSTRDIAAVVDAFVHSAKRAEEAGFRVIELHAAHGYLLQSFLSPVTNHRNDRYGGDREGRMRLLLEVTDAVRSVWPEGNPLFVRISTIDWLAEGWQFEDTLALIRELAERGVDLVDCSSGGINPEARNNASLDRQREYAFRLKEENILPIGVVGGVVDAVEANRWLEMGKADLVIIGRALLRDPHWPLNAAKQLGYPLEWPVQYDRAK